MAKDVKRHLSEKIYKWPKNTHKRCSVSLVIQEMKSRTTVRYPFAFTGTSKLKKTDKDKC